MTEYLAWQAEIVREYKRPDQFITHDFSGGVHTNLDQWAIARNLDIVAENPYFETQDRLNARGIWLTGDLGRSLKHAELPGDGDQRADHRLGFAHAVSALSRAASAGRVRACGRGREHDRVLALVVAALWPGDLLEGRARRTTWSRTALMRSVAQSPAS